MKELKQFFRKAIVICLVACMFLGMIPAAFADEVSDAEAKYFYELDILKQLQAQFADSVVLAAQQAKVDAAYAIYVKAQQAKQAEQAAWQTNPIVEQLPEQGTEPTGYQLPEQGTEPTENQLPEQGTEPTENQFPKQITEQRDNQIHEKPFDLVVERSDEAVGQQEGDTAAQFTEPGDMSGEEATAPDTDGKEPLPEIEVASKDFVSKVFEGLKNVWTNGTSLFSSLVDALNNTGDGGTVSLLGSVADGEALTVATDNTVTIDFGGYTYSVNNGTGSAASFSGNGNVTVSNGTLAGTGTGETVTSSMEHLTFKDMLIQGIHSLGAVLGVYGGETDLVGRTTVDAGDKDDLAITVMDRDGNVDLRVNTTGIVNGGVQVTNIDQNSPTPEYTANAWLHNGYFTGDIDYNGETAMNSKIMVDGGEYFDDVFEYVPYQTNYADVTNAYGTIHSAGANIPWTALRSRWNAPTFVNIRKSGGFVSLPWGVLAKNSSDKIISLNGSLLGRGGVALVGACCCAKHDIVEGGDSEWYKGTEDGLDVELDADISYVTIDGRRVEAEIDGVEAEFGAELLEELSVGKHLVRFVLKDGCSVNTTLKINKDEKIEWAKGSHNGLMFEFEKDVKKVLVNNVKVASLIEKNNVRIGADVFEDLKVGRQTIEFVLKDMSHIVTSVTITK